MNTLKRLLSQLRALFPSKLPVGMTEFDNWISHFVSIYKLPTEDLKSIKFTIATAIMHLGPTVAFKAKHYFYLLVHAGAAKQIAGAKFVEIKEAQRAEQAAEAAKVVESVVVPNENK